MKKNKWLFDFNKESNLFKVITLILGTILLIIILLLIVLGKDNSDNGDNKGIASEMSFTTNKGNVIHMQNVNIENFYIKVPKDFDIMDEQILKLKYPSEKRPKLVYTNEDASINIAFNDAGVSLNGSSLSEVGDAAKLTFEKLCLECEQEMVKVEGLEMYILKVVTQAINAKIYNHMAIFVINNQVIFLSFNCLIDDMSEWEGVADYIISSIRLN